MFSTNPLHIVPVTAAMSPARSRLALALLPAIVTLAVVSFAFAEARILMRDNEWVDHTRLVIERTDALPLRVVRAESEQRGHLATGDSALLASARREKQGAQRVFDELQRLTADNASQRSRLEALARELTMGPALLLEAPAARQRGRADSLARVALLREGGRHTDRVLQLVTAVKAEEERLLGERLTASSQQARISAAVLVLGGALAVIIALVVNLFLTRLINERERMSRELGAQLDDLVAARRELELRVARER